MSKKQKAIFFLAVSLISLGFLLGNGKKAQAAWVQNCWWVFIDHTYWCRDIAEPCHGFKAPCSRPGCGGSSGNIYAANYYNSCDIGIQWCSNVPSPGISPRCHYIYKWNCGESPRWTWINGTSCQDVGRPNCCTANCNNSGSYCNGTPYAGNCGQTCWGTGYCCNANCGNPATVCSGISYGDGCGGICWGTKYCCNPNCGNPATVCSGISYGDGCGGICWGTKNCCTPNCNDSGNYCPGSYTGNCGQVCTGTKVCVPAPTVTLSASLATIPKGNSSTLTWTTANATSCWATNGVGNWTNQPKSSAGSSELTTPTSTTTYTIECWNSIGTSSGPANATVNVTCAPNCNDSDSHCQGTTYTGNCGQNCNGTLPDSCPVWIGNCDKVCGGGIETRSCSCPTRTETRACNSQPCPPGYREVTPW